MYTDMVQEARTLVKRSEADQWRLAELTWEALNVEGKTQEQWATDAGITQGYVSKLTAVWDTYRSIPGNTRPKFNDAYAASRGLPEDRDERRFNEGRKRVAEAEPERKAEVARELLGDPDVAQLVVSDQDTQRALSEARLGYEREVSDTADAERPDRVPQRERTAEATLLGDLYAARRGLRGVLERVRARVDRSSDPDPGFVEDCERVLEEVAADVDVTQRKLAGDLDRDLESLLSEGGTT